MKNEVTKVSDQQEFDEKFLKFYKEALEIAQSIQSKKNATYNGNTVSYEDYIKFPNNYPCLLYGKALRMLSIINGSEVNFESLIDTYLDMINYAAFCYATEKINNE